MANQNQGGREDQQNHGGQPAGKDGETDNQHTQKPDQAGQKRPQQGRPPNFRR